MQATHICDVKELPRGGTAKPEPGVVYYLVSKATGETLTRYGVRCEVHCVENIGGTLIARIIGHPAAGYCISGDHATHTLRRQAVGCVKVKHRESGRRSF